MTKQQKAELRGLRKDTTPVGLSVLHDWLQDNCPEELPQFYMERNLRRIVEFYLDKNPPLIRVRPYVMDLVDLNISKSTDKTLYINIRMHGMRGPGWEIAIRRNAKPEYVYKKVRQEARMMRDNQDIGYPSSKFNKLCALLETP